MATKAKHSFWLDGGYDFEIVQECRHHPNHRWWVFCVGDVVEHCYNEDEMMVICQGCFVPRCGATTDADPCMLWRHHGEAHVLASGKRVPGEKAA